MKTYDKRGILCENMRKQKVDDQKNMYVVEDVKGMKTPVYRLKKKMLKASLGHEIVEVTKENLTELK